jgi:hypothetical protein
MADHKVNILRHLADFNNPTVPHDATLQSLRDRRMNLAAQFMNLGQDINITPPLFVIWGSNTVIGDGTYMNRK